MTAPVHLVFNTSHILTIIQFLFSVSSDQTDDPNYATKCIIDSCYHGNIFIHV
jgi:hypothetical protein